MDIALGRTEACPANSGPIPEVPTYAEMFECFPNWKFSVCISLGSELGVPDGGFVDAKIFYGGQLIDEGGGGFGTGYLVVEGITPLPSVDQIVVEVMPQDPQEVWFVTISTYAQ